MKFQDSDLPHSIAAAIGCVLLGVYHSISGRGLGEHAVEGAFHPQDHIDRKRPQLDQELVAQFKRDRKISISTRTLAKKLL